jgi:hypothetical protein
MIINPTVLESHKSANVQFSQCENSIFQLTANRAATVADANPKRAYAALINNSGADITLILGETTDRVFGKGIILKPSGSFEITQLNLFVGKISAISVVDTNLSFVECFFQ